MLRFNVYREGAPVGSFDLTGSYMFGQDGIPIRSELLFQDGQFRCAKRGAGAAGLAVLWDAGGAGRILLPTCRLVDRDEPYCLNLELARAQMMRIAQKREDWGLFDYGDAESLNREFDDVRGRFIKAYQQSDQAKASILADEAIEKGLLLGEKIVLYHAEVFISRRQALGVMKTAFGCAVNLGAADETSQRRLKDFDFVNIPLTWKLLEPKERQYEFAPADAWMTWATRSRKIVHAGPLLSFAPGQLPDWLFLWENDYASFKDMVYEHVQKVVKRYERQVHVWKVVSGLHAFNSFNLSFEQLMELTRMTSLLVKKLTPHAQVMVELLMPWSEYYARNPKTVPPLMYADMAVQSGVKFDSFGLNLCMGVPVDGLFVRDLLQISSLFDEFLPFNKPLHVLAEVPSDVGEDGSDAWAGKIQVPQAGHWHMSWSQDLQASWAESVGRIVASKPFIESLCWRDLADYEDHFLPHGGLCDRNLDPKPAYERIITLKTKLASKPNKTSAK